MTLTELEVYADLCEIEDLPFDGWADFEIPSLAGTGEEMHGDLYANGYDGDGAGVDYHWVDPDGEEVVQPGPDMDMATGESWFTDTSGDGDGFGIGSVGELTGNGRSASPWKPYIVEVGSVWALAT